MSPLTINKVACRVYASLFLLLGGAFLTLGGLNAMRGSLGVAIGLLAIALLPIAIGLYAYRQYVSVMIVGTVLCAAFPFPPGRPLSEDLSAPMFVWVSLAFVVLLTIAALVSRPRQAANAL